MRFKLVKFEYCDLEGIRIFEPGLNGWDDYIKDAKNFKYPYQTWHGNDYLQFEDFASFEQCFTVKDITDSEAQTIFKCDLENVGAFPCY